MPKVIQIRRPYDRKLAARAARDEALRYLAVAISSATEAQELHYTEETSEALTEMMSAQVRLLAAWFQGA